MKINSIKTILIFTILVLFIYSCTDIIKLDLKNAKSQLVIQANLNTSDSSFSVKLTKTNDYYENGEFELISNAKITLSKQGGVTYTIPETEKGQYFLDDIDVTEGEVFTAKIIDNNNEYIATTTAPNSAKIIQIFPASFNPPGGGPGGDAQEEPYFQITTFWKDAPNVSNYYRLKTYINNELEAGDYNLADDRFEDGDTMVSVSIIQLNHLDTLRVELLSTDKQYFNYFLDVALLYNNGPGNTTPYNPKSNFNNNALGYFGIYSSDKFEIVLP